MIVASDRDYLETRLIKRGIRSINPDFASLAQWINDYYRVKVLNIFYDKIQVAYAWQPRVNIIFEHQEEELQFRHGVLGNFDSDKQKIISQKFRELAVNSGRASTKYDGRNLLVIFSSFIRVAKDDANSAIPDAEIELFKKEFSSLNIWEVSRFGASTTIFVHTDTQAKEAASDTLVQELTQRYFILLKKYDEFDYFGWESFSLEIDSKENFDRNYESNWYYYYK